MPRVWANSTSVRLLEFQNPKPLKTVNFSKFIINSFGSKSDLKWEYLLALFFPLGVNVHTFPQGSVTAEPESWPPPHPQEMPVPPMASKQKAMRQIRTQPTTQALQRPERLFGFFHHFRICRGFFVSFRLIKVCFPYGKIDPPKKWWLWEF